MNQKYILISMFSLALGLFACQNDTSKETASTTINTPTPQVTTKPAMTTAKGINTAISEPKCNIKGKMLDYNKRWLKSSNQVLCIVADESTYDKNFGDSHRILEVYDANCEVIFREQLPINVSPDFHYQLADLNYNQSSQLVAIKGFQNIICYDIAAQKVLPPLQPSFGDVDAVDAQSGRILHLELWEDYLIGYAQDFGVFGYDMKNPQRAQMLKAYASYPIGDYPQAMFLLQSEGDAMQAIMPSYDFDKHLFKINPLLEKPSKIDLAKSSPSKNKRFVVLIGKENNNRTLIDLKTRQLKTIPTNIQKMSIEKILDWATKNIK